MVDCESKLKALKEKYFTLEKKYSLPSFEKLNEDFQIEKIAEEETDLVLREVRKVMVDKFSNYLRFVEGILHPSEAPVFVFSIIKTLGVEEKNLLSDSYRILSRLEVDFLELDIEFSEIKESEFILKSFKEWQEVKKKLLAVIKTIKDNWDNKASENSKSYFG